MNPFLFWKQKNAPSSFHCLGRTCSAVPPKFRRPCSCACSVQGTKPDTVFPVTAEKCSGGAYSGCSPLWDRSSEATSVFPSRRLAPTVSSLRFRKTRTPPLPSFSNTFNFVSPVLSQEKFFVKKNFLPIALRHIFHEPAVYHFPVVQLMGRKKFDLPKAAGFIAVDRPGVVRVGV